MPTFNADGIYVDEYGQPVPQYDMSNNFGYGQPAPSYPPYATGSESWYGIGTPLMAGLQSPYYGMEMSPGGAAGAVGNMAYETNIGGPFMATQEVNPLARTGLGGIGFPQATNSIWSPNRDTFIENMAAQGTYNPADVNANLTWLSDSLQSDAYNQTTLRMLQDQGTSATGGSGTFMTRYERPIDPLVSGAPRADFARQAFDAFGNPVLPPERPPELQSGYLSGSYYGDVMPYGNNEFGYGGGTPSPAWTPTAPFAQASTWSGDTSNVFGYGGGSTTPDGGDYYTGPFPDTIGTTYNSLTAPGDEYYAGWGSVVPSGPAWNEYVNNSITMYDSQFDALPSSSANYEQQVAAPYSNNFASTPIVASAPSADYSSFSQYQPY
jgi:hypothetical protein